MQGFAVGLLVLLAAVFLIRRIRRAGSGHGGCVCGASGGDSRDDGRRVSVPGLTCSGSCARCRGDKTVR